MTTAFTSIVLNSCSNVPRTSVVEEEVGVAEESAWTLLLLSRSFSHAGVDAAETSRDSSRSSDAYVNDFSERVRVVLSVSTAFTVGLPVLEEIAAK